MSKYTPEEWIALYIMKFGGRTRRRQFKDQAEFDEAVQLCDDTKIDLGLGTKEHAEWSKLYGEKLDR
jgi:hypothetical protein